MSIAASLDLLAQLLPLCKDQSLVELVYQRMTDFLNDDLNDQCACAILNVLSHTRLSTTTKMNKEQFWKLILKFSSMSSDVIREKFTKTIPMIIDDPRLTGQFHLSLSLSLSHDILFVSLDSAGVFGANCYLTQTVLFEHFLGDVVTSPEVYVPMLGELFADLLEEIHPDDQGETEAEELNFDRRLWPSSEGYNNVFVAENETCDYYSARYGDYLLHALEQILKQDPSSQRHLAPLIEKLVTQCIRLIEIQVHAYDKYLIRQRSTIRLKLLIDFARITHSLDRIPVERLPRLWR